MAQSLSLIFFSALLLGSLGLIGVMLRESGAEILAALGLEPRSAIAPLPARPILRGARPPRVSRPAPSARLRWRAAA